jgi:hypothetical protein
MKVADYRGARGSLAGTSFHELWALSQAMRLLDPRQRVSAVSVEGIGATGKQETDVSDYDGVDCTILYGDSDITKADRIEIVQLKYSGAKPNLKWNLSRLTESDRKVGNNSVLRRLADAYRRVASRTKISPTVSLISNQPVADQVRDQVKGLASSKATPADFKTKFRKATGLPQRELKAFASSLDLVSRTGSRFELEDELLLQIANWTDDDARAVRENLLSYIRKQMLPENAYRFLLRENIVAIISGSPSEESLFPCPSDLMSPENAIVREASRSVATRLAAGDTHVCLHGGPGSGKTTVLQQLETLLPTNSTVVMFDCYGAGRYLDASRKRHLPSDAFRQICNDIAVRLSLPLFLTRDEGSNARTLVKRLRTAAGTLSALDSSGLLVVAIDAADNSITAAHHFRERSFVEDLVTVEDLPSNVRLIVSCRSSRKAELNLPSSFREHPLTGFTREETGEYVRASLPNVHETWIDDFHELSAGIPRVEHYALKNGIHTKEGPLALLQPSGKTLEVIFDSIFQDALRKVGAAELLSRFCASLVVLPRPIPLSYCAELCNDAEEIIRDLCRDLAPGLRLEGNNVSFADEDIEAYVAQRADANIQDLYREAAVLLLKEHNNSEYAATHVAMMLYQSKQKRELLEIVEHDGEPKAITDPLRRREVQLQRIQLGVHLANDLGDPSSAVRAMLRGAEAVRTDDAILALYRDNLDLASFFAEDSVRRRILLDKTQVESHGALIACLMLKSALESQPTIARSYRRQYRAWLDRRDVEARIQNSKGFNYEQKWKIEVADAAALVEGTFLIEGPTAGLNALASWRPKRFALEIAEVFIPRLLTRRRFDLVKPMLEDSSLHPVLKAEVMASCLRAGHSVSPETIAECLRSRLVRRLVKTRQLGYGWEARSQFAFLDTFVFLCESVGAEFGADPAIRKILHNLAAPAIRQNGRLFDHDSELLNIMVRAYCLECKLDGRKPSSNEFLSRGVEPQKSLDDVERRRVEGLQTVTSLLIDYCSDRVTTLIERDSATNAETSMREAVSRIRSQTYRLAHLFRHDFLRILSLNILDVAHLHRDPQALLSIGASLFGETDSPTGHELTPFYAKAALNPLLQSDVLKWIAQHDSSTRAIEATSRDKVEALTALARLAHPISSADAMVIFRHAHEATAEIDADARFQLKALASLCLLALPSLKEGERKEVAWELTALIAHSAIRLQNEEGFPWADLTRALASLHGGTALAACARWQDSALASLSDTLPALLDVLPYTNLTKEELRLALNPLLEEAGFEYSGEPRTRAVQNDLCRDVLQFGGATEISRLATRLQSVEHTSCAMRVIRRAAILPVPNSSVNTNESDVHRTIPLDRVPESITPDVIAALLESTRKAEHYVAPRDVLKALQRDVAPGDRLQFMDSLVALLGSKLRGEDIIECLEFAKVTWKTLAIDDWIADVIPRLIREQLPVFAEMIIWQQEHGTLDRLLALIEPSSKVGQSLIEGIGNGIEQLSASGIYELMARVFVFLPSSALKDVLCPYVERLIDAQPDINKLAGITDIPDDTDESLARFVFALMSDVDTRLRWRAAHCIRRLVAYGNSEIIQVLAGLWPRTEEHSFRSPGTPFYWQAARLWTITTLSRIACENPSEVAPLKRFLLDVLQDSSFPHPAIRSFGQDAIRELQAVKLISLTRTEKSVVDKALDIGLPRQKRNHKLLENRKQGDIKAARWEFDELDTMPYWFNPASHVFADVSGRQLAEEAERWIVDRWKVDPKYREWRNEPRQSRFSERDYRLRSNDHGSHPIIEDYRTFLAWYGLQCAIGSLGQTKPYSKTDYEDGVDEFESDLERQKLSEPPFWLSDLLSPRPPEAALHRRPADIDKWLSEVSEQEFLEYLERRGGATRELIIRGSTDVRCSEYRWHVSIRTALVSPENSLSLVRALQTAPEPLDFCLPDAGADSLGERFTIDEENFKLEGWISSHASDNRFDDHDPLNFGVSRRIASPFEHALEPVLRDDGVLRWPSTNGIEFSYERWKDDRDVRDSEYEGPELRTSGWRLFASANEVQSFLASVGRELIIEIDLRKERGGRSYQIRKKDESERVREGRFCGIFLFRQDGTVCTAERCLGTWPTVGI